MDWITGLQKAINYIEEHLTEEIDYELAAKESFSSNYHFQRVFSILCGYTLGEYIRNRRLTLAGAELATGKVKVIDVALKYGYDSPDSFAKAFKKFHGITPSQACSDGTMLKSFSRLSVKISLEGGNVMNYRIENKPEMNFLGYGRSFDGSPNDRYNQVHDFCIEGETQFVCNALHGYANDLEVLYHIIDDVTDEGYRFTLGTAVNKYYLDRLEAVCGKYADLLDIITVPEQTYVIVQSEKSLYYMREHMALRHRVITEWFPNSGYQIANAPEIVYTFSDTKAHSDSYVELWIPIEKID